MTAKRMIRGLMWAGAGVGMALAGCATPDAADPRGRWRPVHQFADAPSAIPLQQAYVYQASPADGTLKSLLGRWSRDTRVDLSYQHPNDYTLHAPVAGIRTTDLAQAVAALNGAYAAQQVQILAEQGRWVVRQAGDVATAGE